MFYADSSIVEIVAHGLVAFLFMFAGLYNATSRRITRQHTELLASLGLRWPAFVLHAGYGLQISGGMMVLVDWHADIGAIALIVFTLAAQAVMHRFWTMTDPLRRNYHRLLLLNNCGVLGGLLLIAEPALLGL